ncbi:unnamed protein product [Durusdinium trenchii]|uniref:Tetrapyrrole methylase domain-containing protein n=1 Tax=Durusdinium trenchii TaxID=1381693 RepID=A0ABP0IHM8_9DINO
MPLAPCAVPCTARPAAAGLAVARPPRVRVGRRHAPWCSAVVPVSAVGHRLCGAFRRCERRRRGHGRRSLRPASGARSKLVDVEEIELERPALYMVATCGTPGSEPSRWPIGNLSDITLRALQVLREVDVIFAEDTRTTGLLLSRLGIQLNQRLLLPCHAFNEEQAGQSLLRKLRDNQCAALVSDAGTPLISDPGYAVVRAVRQGAPQVPVRSVPGCCALAAALSVAGLPCSRVLFGGFLPSGGAARLAELRSLLRQASTGTLVLYEAPHRLLNTLEMLRDELDAEDARELAVCRELTKRYETVLRGTIDEILMEVREKPENQKGEVVLLVAGRAESERGPAVDAMEVLRILSAELPESRAVALAAKIAGVPKKTLRLAQHARANARP